MPGCAGLRGNPKGGENTKSAVDSAADYTGGSVVQQGTVTRAGFKVRDSPKSEHASCWYSNGFNFIVLFLHLAGAEDNRDEQGIPKGAFRKVLDFSQG